jgi:ribose-phosphate pyrophosphokinase
MDSMQNIKIFSCNANTKLAKDIANILNIELGVSNISRFSDGEINLEIGQLIRGNDVFIIQPTSPPANEHIMELLIMIDAMKRASADRITAVIPYFGYARQDRKTRSRAPISAKLIADIITKAGADRILTMDLHSDQIQGFFDIPFDHLRGVMLFAEYYKSRFDNLSDFVVVSPDLGSVNRARSFAEKLNIPLAIVDKRRPIANESVVMNIIGEIKNKNVIFIDDIIDTAGSITGAAESLVKNGAKEVYACCTHAVLSGPAVERIQNSKILELLVLDTIHTPKEKMISKIKCLSTAQLFASAIYRIHHKKSISVLLDEEQENILHKGKINVV